MFVCMALITSIGFLIKFTLITGRESWKIYGENVDLLFWGMDRHQWGTIHLYIGLILLGLLILHIYLHCKMIVELYHQLIKSPRTRKISLCILLIVCILLLIAPFAVNPKVVEHTNGKGHRSTGQIYENEIKSNSVTYGKLQNKSNEQYTISGTAIEVKGYMTLEDVAQKYNIPVKIITNQLEIPSSALKEKLGKLRKVYGFKMTDIEKLISEYHESH